MKIEDLLRVIQEGIGLFEENELAYLSLTSKNESVIRDKVAYKLHLELKNSIVVKEYKRIDLAILEGDKIKDIVELKSMYTFDSIPRVRSKSHFKSRTDEYMNEVIEDFHKNSRFLNENVNQYAVIIATHPKQIPNKKYKEAIQYYDKIISSTKKIDNYTILNNTKKSLHQTFGCSQYSIKELKLECGRAFGIDIEVYIWIVHRNKEKTRSLEGYNK